MHTGLVVDRVAEFACPPQPERRRELDPAGSGPPAVIVTCVHGTWARGSRWPDLEKAVAEALRDRGGPIEFKYFQWSGRNSVTHRTQAAADLRTSLRQEIAQSPGAVHFLIAHSSSSFPGYRTTRCCCPSRDGSSSTRRRGRRSSSPTAWRRQRSRPRSTRSRRRFAIAG